MADYKKRDKAEKNMRFEGGKPAGKRGDRRKSYGAESKGSYRKTDGEYAGKNVYGKKRYDDENKGDYGKKYGNVGKNSYEKRGSEDKRYGNRDFEEHKKRGKRDFNDNERESKREYAQNARKERGFEENKHSKRRYTEQISVYNDDDATSAVQVREDELPFLIMGRNAVREAIKSGRSIDKILVVSDRDGSLREIIGMARDRNILIQEESREKLDEICMPFGHGDKTGNHQGIVARVPGAEYVEVSDILEYARERNEKPFVLLLDGITDPYNLGSMIRSAECAGVHGIIIPKRRSATLTSSAVKVSAGAASHMRVAKVPNIASAIDKLRDEGLWIVGTDMDGKSMYKTDLRGAVAFVIGSEGQGLSALVRKKCDFIVSAPVKGHIDSLNAAVAAAVVMFEKTRQDGAE